MTVWAILSIALQVLVLLAVWLLKRAGSGYAETKGKNLATKQDIAEITDQIKSVEAKHQVAIELQKSRLQVSADSATTVLELKNDALLKFFDDCIQLFGDKLRTNLGDLPANDAGDSIFQHIADTKSLFREVFTDYHRLLLFLGDQDNVLKQASKVVSSVMELETVYKRHITRIRIALKEEVEAHSANSESYTERVKESDSAKNAYDKDMTKPLQDFRKNFMDYIESIQDSFSMGTSALSSVTQHLTEPTE